LAIFEGYGPAATWSLEISGIDPGLIEDVLLTFHTYIPESDDRLEAKVTTLLKAYEQKLAKGDALDRVAVILLGEQFPDILEQVQSTGTASFQVQEKLQVPSELTDVKVKTIIAQTVDRDKKGKAGIALEIAKPGTAFSIARTTRQDGYSEDLSSPPPVFAPADRVPMIGTWQIRLTNPAQGNSFDNVLLFFLYEFKKP